jgi:hypothetical protein
MTFLETAEDDSRTNRVEESVDILVGPFGPSWPTVNESISDIQYVSSTHKTLYCRFQMLCNANFLKKIRTASKKSPSTMLGSSVDGSENRFALGSFQKTDGPNYICTVGQNKNQRYN